MLSDGYDPKDVYSVAVSTPIESNDRMVWKTIADHLETGLAAQIEGRLEEVRKAEQMAASIRLDKQRWQKERDAEEAARRAEKELEEDHLPDESEALLGAEQ